MALYEGIDSGDGRPPSAAFRPRGVTPKRGNNVASPLRGTPAHYPAKNWTDKAHFKTRVRIAVGNPTAFEERAN